MRHRRAPRQAKKARNARDPLRPSGLTLRTFAADSLARQHTFRGVLRTRQPQRLDHSPVPGICPQPHASVDAHGTSCLFPALLAPGRDSSVDPLRTKKGVMPEHRIARSVRPRCDLCRQNRQQSCAASRSPLTDSNRRPVLTMRPDWQLVATRGNGFGLIPPFSGHSHLPPIATGCDVSHNDQKDLLRVALDEEGSIASSSTRLTSCRDWSSRSSSVGTRSPDSRTRMPSTSSPGASACC
jgi:hypothetical protein